MGFEFQKVSSYAETHDLTSLHWLDISPSSWSRDNHLVNGYWGIIYF